MKIRKSERQKGCRKDEMVKRQSTKKRKGLTHMATVATGRNQVYHLQIFRILCLGFRSQFFKQGWDIEE